MPPRGTVVVSLAPLIRRLCKAISIVCVGDAPLNGCLFALLSAAPGSVCVPLEESVEWQPEAKRQVSKWLG